MAGWLDYWRRVIGWKSAEPASPAEGLEGQWAQVPAMRGRMTAAPELRGTWTSEPELHGTWKGVGE